MAKNYIQDGESLTIPAPSGGAVSGAPYQVDGLHGVFLSTASVGVPVALMTEGVWELDKKVGDVVTLGLPLFLDTGEMTITGDGLAFGVAVEAAGAPATTVKVKICCGLFVPEP
jgi:predicted RecA/RadA family phage recombinase